MLGITLLPQTGLDELCTIQAKTKIKNAQGRKDLTWCSFYSNLVLDTFSHGLFFLWRMICLVHPLQIKLHRTSEKFDTDKNGMAADCA